MARVAYLDCASGISGDMTLGALVDAGVELARMDAAVGSLGLPGCRLTAQQVRKGAFRATQVEVEYEPEHAHRHLSHILALIDAYFSIVNRPMELDEALVNARDLLRETAANVARVFARTVNYRS